MEKYISVSKEGMERLKEAFKVGERCVKNALAFRSDNDLARKIRFTAKSQHGGCTYYVGKEMECFFDSDGSMHQIFPNGAEICIDKGTGEGMIYHKGRVARRYDAAPVVAMINEMQQTALALK